MEKVRTIASPTLIVVDNHWGCMIANLIIWTIVFISGYLMFQCGDPFNQPDYCGVSMVEGHVRLED